MVWRIFRKFAADYNNIWKNFYSYLPFCWLRLPSWQMNLSRWLWNKWVELPQSVLNKFMERYPKKEKEIDAMTVHKGTTINSAFGLHGLLKDTLEERIINFPSIKAGSLNLNDLYVSTACHSLLIGSAFLMHTSLIIDAPKKHFVFLPHNGQKVITVKIKTSMAMPFSPRSQVTLMEYSPSLSAKVPQLTRRA